MNDTPIDPALAENIDEISNMLHEIGASGVWLLHDIQNMQIETDDNPGLLLLGDGGLFLVAKFPARDGRGPDVDWRRDSGDG